MHEALYDAVFFLLDFGVHFWVDAACIGGVDEAVNENDQLDGEGASPVCEVDPRFGRLVVGSAALRRVVHV